MVLLAKFFFVVWLLYELRK